MYNYNYQVQSEIISMAMDAYIYGFPLVLMDVTRRSGIKSIAQINRFYHQRKSFDSKFNMVVRPNVDTLYSSAFLDLSHGPIIFEIPNCNNNYYVFELLDAWSNVFASIGTRTRGEKGGAFTIIGPNTQHSPNPGEKIIISPTNTVWIIGRIQTDGPCDYEKVNRLQDQFCLQPVQILNKLSSIVNFIQEPIVLGLQSPKKYVSTMDGEAFFTTLMKAMAKNPPYHQIQNTNIITTLTTLGLIPSPDFNFKTLDPLVQEALNSSTVNGPNFIKSASFRFFQENRICAWSMTLDNIGYYGCDYLKRAVVAYDLFGANIPQDSVYAYAYTDDSDDALNGKNIYTIHFEKDCLPPVNAFWSITLYNKQGYLVENPLQKHAISPHLQKLKFNSKGGLDILLQNTPPQRKLVCNWLPTPPCDFNLLLRMYYPKKSLFECEWLPPSIIKRP